ncbi:MAG: SET domain-containing protein-lysine N-methyltransferase [Candidatus Obscuribacterales bacterium]|nr:SET domain-containing protein-lysine N-methyltransferase [Candidatus Obscuribacterales bacterium]
MVQSWISPKAVKGMPSKINGLGFFAVQDIASDEIVAIKGGHIVDKATLDANRHIIKNSLQGIADGLWLAPLTEEEYQASLIYLNHSCEPNLFIQGQIAYVSLRVIRAGEELTMDYGISCNDPELQLECNCGSSQCRKFITGVDWKRPELQERYKNKFSCLVQGAIDAQLEAKFVLI